MFLVPPLLSKLSADYNYIMVDMRDPRLRHPYLVRVVKLCEQDRQLPSDVLGVAHRAPLPGLRLHCQGGWAKVWYGDNISRSKAFSLYII